MTTLNHNSSSFRNTLIAASVLFTAVAGCGLPIYEEGEICDQALTLEWEESQNPELDHVDFMSWTNDPELEQELLSYGMVDAKDFLGGNDINEDGIVVSPYGKTMNAYDFIVNTPGLEGWGDFLRAKSYPVRLSCGTKANPRIVAYTYFGRKKIRETHVYELFYKLNVVQRAGFLIHEAGHAAGMPNHVAGGNKDQSWETDGPYRLQLEFLAAVFYAEGASQAHKIAAGKAFNSMIKGKFVEKTDVTLASFAPGYTTSKDLEGALLAAVEGAKAGDDQAEEHFVAKCGSDEAP